MNYDAKAITTEFTRSIIQTSKFNRQRATSNFPLCVFNMANDMRKLLDLQEHNDINYEELQNTIDYLEFKIREEYEKLFGVELGGITLKTKLPSTKYYHERAMERSAEIKDNANTEKG